LTTGRLTTGRKSPITPAVSRVSGVEEQSAARCACRHRGKGSRAAFAGA
jgi:hypothetical protein